MVKNGENGEGALGIYYQLNREFGSRWISVELVRQRSLN